MTIRLERREPGATTTDRPRSNLRGTWTIDPAHSSVAFTRRALRLWTITGRRHCTGVIHLDALPPVGAVRQHRWWTLHSQSLEILPSGAWRVMATLTAYSTPGLVELRLEVDPEQSRRGWLVLRGRGVLDRRALAIGRRAWRFHPTIRLDLAVRAPHEWRPAPALRAMKQTSTTSMPP